MGVARNFKMAALEHFNKANVAFVEEDFEESLEQYNAAITADSSNADFFNGRSQLFLRIEKYQEALNDAVAALDLNGSNPKYYMRKGVALFNLNNIQDAWATFAAGKAYGDEKKFDSWIEKCEKIINTDNESGTSKPVAVPVQMPTGPKTRYDWYQTETHVIITIMVKGRKKEDVNVDIQEHTLSAQVKLDTGSDYTLELDLANPILPAQSMVKVLSTKIEIKLKKQDGIRWTALESDQDPAPVQVKHFTPDNSDTSAHKYPSSSHYTRNWDKLAQDITKEEKDEKLDGDAALNKLFQQIYSDASDDTRRAMNKSYQESGGTVLSTNWKDIGKEKTEIKPPDGMEYKKWDQ